MKKVLIFIIMVCLSVFITGCGKVDKKTVLNKFEKKVNNVNGYQIEAEMELINNEGSYTYDVVVSYKKKDNFRVSLRNKTNNHEQIILKNDDGVYVLSPNLNKSFKFQSKWPYNNSQSYLVQSILNDMKNDDKLTMKETKSGYVFESKVNYKNNSRLTHQKVTIDKNYLIKKVVVYDDEENAQIKVNFKSIDMKAKFDDDYFSIEENMKTSIDDDSEVSFQFNALEEAIYPMYLPEGTYLESEKTVDLTDGERIILTFAGNSPFMLVEETVSISDEMQIIPTSGDVDLFASGFAIIGDSSVSFTQNGIDYYLVSSELSKEELITVAKSMSVMPVGK